MTVQTADVEMLYFDGCPHAVGLAEHLRALLAAHNVSARVVTARVDTDEQAQQVRFLGSPSVRVNGRDVEPAADQRTGYGMQCRLYQTAQGVCGTPPDVWVLAAVGAQPI